MIDHLLWAVPELENGIEDMVQRTGVRAAHGGRHPGLGTHNALLGLGGDQYLEILARDPEQEGGLRSFGLWLENLTAPRLITWAAATDDAEELAERALQAGLEPAPIVDLSRQRPDGSTFRGRVLQIGGHQLGPCLPFFIQRGAGSPHPSTDAPAGLLLDRLVIEHNNPAAYNRTAAALGLEVDAGPGPQPALRAVLSTPLGQVELA